MLESNRRYLSRVYGGLVNGLSPREIAKNVRKVTLDVAEEYRQPQVERLMVSFAKRMCRRRPKEAPKGILLIVWLTNWAYDQIRKAKIYERASAMSADTANRIEAEGKRDMINMALVEARREKKFIYLCSWHGDCAEDHVPYQGRLYYDRFYRKSCSKAMQREVQALVKERKLRSMQWVINRPAWLITRPNCRHYLKAITLNEARDIPVDTLLETYHMKTEKGKRNMATIPHPTNRGWYTPENVQAIIDKYEERLNLHREMYEAAPSEELANAIEKDRALIAKWKRFLTSRKNRL